MLALALLVVSIAVADSLNPGTIAPALYFATSAHPARKTLAFAAGVFAVNLVGGIALLLGPGRLVLGALPHPGADAKQLAELGLGAAALAGVSSGRSAARMQHLRALLLAHIGALIAGVLLIIGIALVAVGASGAVR